MMKALTLGALLASFVSTSYVQAMTINVECQQNQQDGRILAEPTRDMTNGFKVLSFTPLRSETTYGITWTYGWCSVQPKNPPPAHDPTPEAVARAANQMAVEDQRKQALLSACLKIYAGAEAHCKDLQ